MMLAGMCFILSQKAFDGWLIPNAPWKGLGYQRVNKSSLYLSCPLPLPFLSLLLPQCHLPISAFPNILFSILCILEAECIFNRQGFYVLLFSFRFFLVTSKL